MSQKVTVKEVKVVKEGDKDGRHWKKLQVIGTDGAQLGSFDTKLEGLPAGTILDCEIKVNGRYTDIEKFEIVSQPSAAIPSESVSSTAGAERSSAPARYSGPSPEVKSMEIEAGLRNELIRRVSIEGQVALKEVGDTIRAILSLPDSENAPSFEDTVNSVLGPELLGLYRNTLKNKIGLMLGQAEAIPSAPAKVAPAKPPAKDPAKPQSGKLDIGTAPTNLGELFTRCQAKGVTRQEVLDYLSTTEKDLPKLNLEQAWITIATGLIAEKDAAKQESKGGQASGSTGSANASKGTVKAK